MRFGITILPEHPWSKAKDLWRQAEDFGFDHASTYDHITWSGLPDGPWFSATTTLTGASTVTERIKLGMLVASANFRHPGTFMRDITALDDISGGRFLLGLGTGGDADSKILGGPDLTTKQRVDRFEEFAQVLDVLLTNERVSHQGEFFPIRELSTAPGPTQKPRTPFVMAGNGPRSVRMAATLGAGWVTMGVKGDDEDDWWASLIALNEKLDAALDKGDRDVESFPRYLSMDAGHRFSLESPQLFEDMVGRAGEIGFTDVITHWPRPDSPYAGSMQTLETVVGDVIPKVRQGLP
ncbi:LLM class flavin-dependent oxidoreductase [Yimella sp. RIT 621]|uniref:LLM class flavin-dependent oxidoreductase n=1 Tax=Yimella sp. RIT 621 TaxID=2510323 RepID=UPI00101C7AF9|nr:LLM class flavin-dependent oxidoreductase [Yimella sp. RIT 621]RYG76450.1 LLM class flavin-dependent oxidoreductase [Yimella sp. RIT 621]